MAPVVLLSPALKTLVSSLAPWLLGAATAGGMAGYQRATNARLRARLDLQGNLKGPAESAPGLAGDGADARGASPSVEPPTQAAPQATDVADDTSSPKTSFLRKIMESNITLRKQRTG